MMNSLSAFSTLLRTVPLQSVPLQSAPRTPTLAIVAFLLAFVARPALSQDVSVEAAGDVEQGSSELDKAAEKRAKLQHSADSKDLEYWNSEVVPFFKQYCYDCHSGDGAEADVNFEQYTSPEQMSQQRPRWNQIRGMIEIGAMPPADYDPLPPNEVRQKIAGWIDQKANRVDCEITNEPGRVTLRRLNSVEYDNTVRDLLGVDVRPSEFVGFPDDDVGNGFDNQGNVLTLAPLQLEKYVQAAEFVTSKVFVHDADSLRDQSLDGEKVFVNRSAEREFEFADGKYLLRVRCKYGGDKDEKINVSLLLDGKVVKQDEVAGDRNRTVYAEVEVSAGKHTLGIRFDKDPNTDRTDDYDRRLEIDSFRIKGPEKGPPPYPAAHRNVVIAEPTDDISVEQAARTVFQPLIRRAFRREPTEQDISRAVQIVRLGVDEGLTYLESVEYAVQSLLVSPHFLFRVELETDTNTQDGNQPISDYALAARLSYFLWSSMPDDELLDLAAEGKLRDPQTLKSQASRMLSDPKAAMLVNRFFGQLFGLGNLRKADPDTERFRLWNERLMESMLEETQRYCREIIQQDMPLEKLINGDFTFVNPRLAELYGMKFEGRDPTQMYVDGPGFPTRRRASGSRAGEYQDENKWIRVELPEGRRGILTHGSILTLTSFPTSTSPVKRGKWILESVFGDPPPPAPPNVPTFEETKKEHEKLSLRQQLEIHRANPSCASCHDVMDPLGLGFENFDAIGAWRDKDGNAPIDAAGQLADGRKFNGPVELVALIETRIDEVARHVAENMLTFAIGRGLEPYDFCAVDEICEAAKKDNYKVSSLVAAVVTSRPFTQRSADPAVAETSSVASN